MLILIGLLVGAALYSGVTALIQARRNQVRIARLEQDQHDLVEMVADSAIRQSDRVLARQIESLTERQPGVAAHLARERRKLALRNMEQRGRDALP